MLQRRPSSSEASCHQEKNPLEDSLRPPHASGTLKTNTQENRVDAFGGGVLIIYFHLNIQHCYTKTVMSIFLAVGFDMGTLVCW